MATVFASCDKVIEEAIVENPETVSNIVTLHANVGPDSKVQTDNAGVFTWQAGDVISVLNNSGAAFDFETTTAGTSVDFTGTFASGSLGSYAMYPACDKHEAAGDDINFSLPATLDWSANASNMPMLGKVSGSSANFQAVGGVLKLVCYNIPSGAEWLQFIATNKQITGDFLIDGSEANPAIETAAKVGSNNELDIDFSASYSANKVFYIPLPTGTIDGFTVSILDGNLDELFSKTTTANLVVGLNKLILGPALNCAPITVLVSEDFSSYSAGDVPSSSPFSCTDGTSDTKIYEESNAGGTSPELLIGKSGGTFKISGINCTGITTMYVTFKKNDNALSVTATDGITVTGATSGAGTKTITLTNVGTGTPKTPLTSFDLTFAAGSKNVRFDDVVVSVAQADYDAPALTPDEDALEIAVGSTTATTDFTYANKVDEMPVVAVVNDEAEEWLSAAITGTYPDYTLTVTASGAHNGATDRTGTVTLKASGVKKAIVVTQKTKLVPNPTVTVTPDDGQFSASWTADANASSYVAYLHTAATATPATGGTDITSSISHVGTAYSITDYATDNGTYYLYIKVNGVTSGYEAPTAYVEKTFTCEGTPKGSAEENPYTVAEAIAKYDEVLTTVSNVYVMGIVSTAGSLYGKNNYVCCYISADGTTTSEFELYNITSGEGTSDLVVGDAIIAHGTLTKYSSTYELSGTTIDAIIKKPVFTPNGANFVTSQSVAIASTGSSSIRYTTDGSSPTVSSGSVYSSALDLSATTTVKAVGIDANGVVCTAVASATFTKVSAYAVTWSAPSNGSITVKHGLTTLTSGDTVPQGETVTITVTPDDGYVLSTLSYNDGSAHDIKAAKSFTMPASAVSITATFEAGAAKTNQVLFHETFGDNTGNARAWDDSYSVKSGVSAVYSGITSYTVSNVKQGKNTTGSTQSGMNQSASGTDAYIIIGPLSVASAENMVLTYQWKAGSTKGTYTTSLYYKTSSSGSFTEVSGTGNAIASSFVTRTYNLPAAAQVSTLYLKIVWNTSNTQAIIDEVNLQGDY